MHITKTGSRVRLTMDAEEAVAIGEDLGGIRASEISAAGDELHRMLDAATEPATEAAR